MTKIVKISMVVVVGTALVYAGPSQFKKYGVESGKIDYKITGGGGMMGMKTKTVGKKRVIFTNFGAKELNEENKVTKTIINGKTSVDEMHKLVYMDESLIYTVDLDSEKIMRMKNPSMILMSAMSGGKSNLEMGEAMLKNMGGKKVGIDKVLDYTCDVWEAMGIKQCIYKGIPLKVESNIMGMKTSEVAVKAEFGVDISRDDMKLPDFPVYDKMGNKMDKSGLASMDKADKKENKKSTEQMAKGIATMAEAAKSVGIKPGSRPTEAQMQAMMNSMLPMMKKEILSKEKGLLATKSCIEDADTVKEANVCYHIQNDEIGSRMEDIKVWNNKEKKEALKHINEGIDGMNCIKNAKTVVEAKGCMK